jgi:hypothetical protein
MPYLGVFTDDPFVIVRRLGRPKTPFVPAPSQPADFGATWVESDDAVDASPDSPPLTAWNPEGPLRKHGQSLYVLNARCDYLRISPLSGSSDFRPRAVSGTDRGLVPDGIECGRVSHVTALAKPFHENACERGKDHPKVTICHRAVQILSALNPGLS